MQPSGCIHEDHIDVSGNGSGHGIKSNGRWIGTGALPDDRGAHPFSPNGQLFNRCGPESVRSNQHDDFSLLPETVRYFPDGGGLSDAVNACNHNDHGFSRFWRWMFDGFLIQQGKDMVSQHLLEFPGVFQFFPRHLFLDGIEQGLGCSHADIGCEKYFLKLIHQAFGNFFFTRKKGINPACERGSGFSQAVTKPFKNTFPRVFGPVFVLHWGIVGRCVVRFGVVRCFHRVDGRRLVMFFLSKNGHYGCPYSKWGFGIVIWFFSWRRTDSAGVVCQRTRVSTRLCSPL